MPSFPSSGASIARGQDTPPGGSSAPVLEFLCLFTHDLRRKQKRWQDGRLKFHTFNKRVMVYDDRGNFIGDMHWQRDYDFDEGEEVQLERGGVIVQVSECVGRQNQDLSGLLDKRAREKEQRQTRTVARPIGPAPQAQPLRTPIPAASVRLEHADHPQPLHRPLHQSIGTPTGHYGRAVVPTESPFERRQQANETPENASDTRAAKRRKYDDTPPSKMGYAQALFGAQLSLSAVPMSSAPVRRLGSSMNRMQSDQLTSQEQDRRQGEALDQVREVTATSAVRAGLSRASTIAPLLKAPPEPRKTVPERTRKLVEPRPERVVVTHPQSRPEPAEPPEQRARKPEKRDRGPDNRQSATSKTGTVQGKSKRPALSSSVTAGSGAISLVDTEEQSAARTQLRGPRSKSIISDEEISDEKHNGVTAAKFRESTTDARISKRTAPEVQKQKTTKRKQDSPLPTLPPSVQATSKRLPSKSKNDRKEKEITPEQEEQEEPRVELRIKPRQKRGLLMLSDKGGSKPKRSKARHESTANPEISPKHPKSKSGDSSGKHSVASAQSPMHISISENGDNSVSASSSFPTEAEMEAPIFEMESPKLTSPENMTAGRSKTAESIYNLPESRNDEFVTRSPPRQNKEVPQKPANEATAMQSATNTRKNTRQPPKQPSTVMEACETSHNQPSEDELPTRKLRKRTTLPVEDSESEEEELPQVPVGPRLARLGRKSVKSREVIGFIPSSSPVPRPVFNGGLFPQLLPMYDKDPASGAKESEAAPEIESTVREIENEPSPVEFGSSAHARQPPPLGLVKDAEIRAEVEPPSLTLSENSLYGKKMTTATSNLSTESCANALNEESCPSEVREEAVSINALSKHDHAASIGQSVPSNRPANTDLAYAGTAGNMQNSAARANDSAPKTLGPFADTRAIPAAATTPALHPKSHRNEDLSNPQTTPIISPHDVQVLLVAANAPKDPAAQHSSAGSSNRPRIANPATRGRKAALKSDAAGQVPQSILPPPEAVVVRPNIRAPQAARTDVTVNECPKRVMRFPGFTTARVGGGPWSREADDLLETGRPA